MAHYYVDTQDGSNAASGSYGSPVKSLLWAILQARSGIDTIHITAGDKTPCRGISDFLYGGRFPNSVTIKGDEAPAYMTSAVDITHGKERGNLLLDSGTDHDLWHQNGSDLVPMGVKTYRSAPNVPVKEKTIVNTPGSNSIKCLNSSADNSYCDLNLGAFPAGMNLRVEWAWKNEVIDEKLAIALIQTIGDVKYWRFEDTNPAWGVAQNYKNNQPGVQWKNNSHVIAMNSKTGKHKVKLRCQNVSKIIGHTNYFDDISAYNNDHPIYNWEDQAGIYKLPQMHTGQESEIKRVFYCTTQQWAKQGIFSDFTTLFNYSGGNFAVNLSNVRLNNNSFTFDKITGDIYINIGAENINSIHIECSDFTSILDVSGVSANLYNLRLALSGGLLLQSSNSHTFMRDVSGKYARGGFNFSGGSVNWVGGELGYASAEEGQLSVTGIDLVGGVVGSLAYIRSHHNDDDGFQCDGSGSISTMNLFRILADHNKDHGISFKCKSTGAGNAKGSISESAALFNGGNGLNDWGGLPYQGHEDNALDVSGLICWGNKGALDVNLYRIDDIQWYYDNFYAGRYLSKGCHLSNINILEKLDFSFDSFDKVKGRILLNVARELAFN